MNTFFTALGLESWKGLLAPLLLPPAPFLALMLLALAWAPRHRRRAWVAGGVACAGVWFSCAAAVGEHIEHVLMGPLRPLAQQDLARLAAAQRAQPTHAVLVLGAGVHSRQSELGRPQPSAHSLARLRHGVWIARHTGMPLAYSGGASYLRPQAAKEAHVAQRVAAEELGLPVRWAESRSRDTRENAAYSVALLRAEGIHSVVLVTHGWHMRRALRAFEEAARQQGVAMVFVPAPMDVGDPDAETGPLAWMPSAEGFRRVRAGLREVIGLAAGA